MKRVIVSYRDICEWAGLDTMRAKSDWYSIGATKAAGYAGRVVFANGKGAALIDLPEDPSWMLPL